MPVSGKGVAGGVQGKKTAGALALLTNLMVEPVGVKGLFSSTGDSDVLLWPRDTVLEG